MNTTRHAVPRHVGDCAPDQEAERLRRIDELKQKIRSGTYLINKYEIIDGLINELAAAAVPLVSGE